ncbi:phosphate ABC transporter permease PstA [Aestuariimicrobium kwangyangense]|uniref:phosphate ABC transporter permease PstA n=1 Tax=Aestuariimicrobium kwangyangense TaxID=396389 RepID=UPI0003B7B802
MSQTTNQSPTSGTSYSPSSTDLGRPKGSRQFVDNLMRVLIWFAAVVAIIPLLWILATVFTKGAALLVTAEPDYTRICVVEAKAPDGAHQNYRRVPESQCNQTAGTGQAQATHIWSVGGAYPAVGQYVDYNAVPASTSDPNQRTSTIRIKGQTQSEQKAQVVGIPGGDKQGKVRTFSLQWWTTDQSRTDQTSPNGGALHAIVGTLEIGLITSIVAVPLGILGAIYLVEYGRGKRLARLVSFMVDILTGVPSIVAALFIYALLITVFGMGRSTFASSMALVLLMLPTVLRSTEEMLKLVPDSLREASYALGVAKWRTILQVVVPTSFTGIATGVVLGMARVMGETAPLLILLNYGPRLVGNPFGSNMGSLPTMITGAANTAANYPGAERGWGAALTLILLVMGLNLIAKFIGARTKKTR